jgi:hypothetical protein
MAAEGTLAQATETIPGLVVTGTRSRFRCCVHRECAVVRERVKLALGNSAPAEPDPAPSVKGASSRGIVQVIEDVCRLPVHSVASGSPFRLNGTSL